MSSPEAYLASQPQQFIAYAPQGAGLECAVVYFVQGSDVYGWWTGFRDYGYPCAFFQLENFFSQDRRTELYASEGGDLYGGWRYAYSRSEPTLADSIRVPDDICHKLAQLQDGFAAEWLWYRGQPGSEADARAYERDELAVEEANIRHRHLGRLRKDKPVWTFASAGLSSEVIDYLAQRWPLDYGKD